MLIAERAIAGVLLSGRFWHRHRPIGCFLGDSKRRFAGDYQATKRLRDVLVGTDSGWSLDSRVEKSKYARKCTYVIMAHKTLTISEEAYNALARLKSKDESFTKVILRLAERKTKGNLLDYVRSFAPDNELADRMDASHHWSVSILHFSLILCGDGPRPKRSSESIWRTEILSQPLRSLLR